MKRSEFLRGALALAAGCCFPKPSFADSQSVLSFVQWSDVHWGSDEDCPSAWNEALQRGLEENPPFALFTGDHGDNGKGRGDFGERLKGFWGPTLEALGNKPFALTLGNTDFRANYQTDPDTLREARQLHRELLGSRYYLDELGNGVAPGGFGGVRWISINTQIFSFRNRYPGAEAQGEKTLQWLETQLQTYQPKVLLAHLPPCIDLYTGSPSWRPNQLQRLHQLLTTYGVECIMSGHFHRNEVHAVGKTPLLICGSLSQKYGYSPNWRSHRWTWQERKLQRIHYGLQYPGHSEWNRPYEVGDVGQFLSQVDSHQYLEDLFGHQPDILDAWPKVQEQYQAVLTSSVK